MSPIPFTVIPPNIVLILTDDQRFDELNPPGLVNMPNVQSKLQSHGVTFSDAYVTNPLCCPSRTSILTGKYSHSTDVYTNLPPHGGFGTFTNRGEDRSTVGTWLQDSGYETALIGKYLNGYAGHGGYVPPGWDTWDAFSKGPPGGSFYFDYQMSHNGNPVSYGSAPSDYSTDVLADDATNFIQSTPSNKPLFLYFAPSAPHGPSTPPPRYADAFPGLAPLDEPSINEPDVSDKPDYIQALPPSPGAQVDREALRRKQFQALLGVDDAVASITQALSDTGRLSSSLIVFASDNGEALGEHRWDGKRVAYDESIHIPLVVRYDPLTRQGTSVDPHMIVNEDFAPTFAKFAGTTAPGAEGRSILPLLLGAAPSWRTDFLIEHEDFNTPRVPAYCGIRAEGWMYVEYATGEEELYNVQDDPYEIDNLLVTRPNGAVVIDKHEELHTRMLDLCSPAPPGFTPLNPDDTPPTQVVGLKVANVTDTTISLRWQRASDDVGVLAYTVYRDGVRIGTTESIPTSDESDSPNTYKDTGLSPASTHSYTVEAYDSSDNAGARSQPVMGTTLASDPTIVAAGDIACDPTNKSFKGGSGTVSACRMKYTSDLIDPSVSAVLTLGNEQYNCGGSVGFSKSYDPTWGRQKRITRPAPGDREYAVGPASQGCSSTGSGAGYFGYFGSAAGDPTKGYYSFDVSVPSGGPWHIIALNSNCGKVGGCGAGSPQERWLQADLLAHPTACTLSFWNAPRFSSQANQPKYSAFWQDLYKAGTEIVLNAQDADYERFAPQDPAGQADGTSGISEFIVGTGGAKHGPVPASRAANSMIFNRTTFGILKLTLGSGTFDWRFIPEQGKTFSDVGSGTCH